MFVFFRSRCHGNSLKFDLGTRNKVKHQSIFNGRLNRNKIVGGLESIPNSWPWTVSIQYNYKHICGGTLINEQVIKN